MVGRPGEQTFTHTLYMSDAHVLEVNYQRRRTTDIGNITQE